MSEEDINNSSVENLRNELFDYRVDIKSYKRNLNTIIIASSVLISVLAFFGYNKIDAIEESILERANNRLAITDSILAKIDQAKIDSLNTLLVEKEKEYKLTISNFEKIVTQNKDLEMKLLVSLPENERIKSRNDSYYKEYPTDFFEVRPFKTILKNGQKESLFLVFKDDVEFSPEDYLTLKLYPKDRNIMLMDKCYLINSKFNKLSFGLSKYDNYKTYTLEIAYYRKENRDSFRKCYITKDIELYN